tara:strand:+ start:1807 stop:2016 length:210 start_codon:yes stop_codon:yes gene_type:complete
MKTLLPILVPIIKWSGVVVAVVAQFSALLPPEFLAYGLLASAGASALKDTALKIGDVIDDGKSNNSFKA